MSWENSIEVELGTGEEEMGSEEELELLEAKEEERANE